MQADLGRGWVLQGEGRNQGVYDAVVIAHNGGKRIGVWLPNMAEA
jgi:hypothetical protein